MRWAGHTVWVSCALVTSLGGCQSRPSTTTAPSVASAAKRANDEPPASPPTLDASVSAHASDTDLEDAATKAPSPPAELSPRTDDGMLLVPGGTFTMGADSGGEGDERPAHPVTLRPFYLDVTEVTQSAYDQCVVANACVPADPDILNTFQGLFRGPNKPVVGISWHAAKQYCEWAHKRLPREAEFERAVRGDDARRFPWGHDAPTKERAVYSANFPEEVGTHPDGKGPYGHQDLAGNVWEWMADNYDPFAYVRPSAHAGEPGTCEEILATQNQLRAQGKQGFTGTNPIPNECEKSIRGGAYNYPAGGLRSTNRVHHPARFKLRMTGVRCAKDAG